MDKICYKIRHEPIAQGNNRPADHAGYRVGQEVKPDAQIVAQRIWISLTQVSTTDMATIMDTATMTFKSFPCTAAARQ